MSKRQIAAFCILLAGGLIGATLWAVAAQYLRGDFRKIGIMFPGVAIGLLAALPLARRVLDRPHT